MCFCTGSNEKDPSASPQDDSEGPGDYSKRVQHEMPATLFDKWLERVAGPLHEA